MPEDRQVFLIRYISRLLVVSGLLSLIYFLLIRSWIFAASALVWTALFVSVGWAAKSTRLSGRFTLLLLCGIYLSVAAALMHGDFRYDSLIWMTLVPAAAFVLLGSKRGLTVNFLFAGVLLLFLLLLPRSQFPLRSCANVILCVATLIFVLFASERSLELSQQALRRRQEELEHLSTVDALTGLYNRLKIDQIIADRFALIEKQPGPVEWVLIILDIDRFKRVNDTYGHQQGDVALQSVARALREGFAPRGKVARWGGEEFLVSLFACAPAEACRLAEDARLRIASAEFPGGMHITVSMGFAVYRPGESYDSFLHRADDFLYDAKRRGRNRLSGDLPESKS